MSLSAQQTKIVTASINQPIQVLASAGSGKTRVLTERIRYILGSTRKDGIIALTFTNKAADEMMSRLSDIEEISERCWIATVHAVAQRVLEQYGHTIGLPSELHIYERDQDRKTIFLQSLRESGIDIDSFFNTSNSLSGKTRESIIRNYMENFSIIKRELLNKEEIKNKYQNERHFLAIFQSYQDSLIESGGIDFDDILVYAHRILLDQSWCARIYRAKYKHLCVDEAQDLNKAQYEFLKALCGDDLKSIFMVGDPNQMIYGFNGSSHDYLCKNFIHDYQPEQYRLRENFRSSKAVIHLANQLKPGSQIESDFVLDGRLQCSALDNEQEEALWVCDKIRELLKEKTHPEIEGDISLEKMVVIARNRFVFKCLQEELQRQNINFSQNNSERHIEPFSTFGHVLDLGIRIRLNNKDWVDGKKLCTALKISYPKEWGTENLLESLAEEARKSDIPFPNIQADLLIALQNLEIEEPRLPKLCRAFERLLSEQEPNEFPDELERSLQELQEFEKRWITFKRKGLGDSLLSFRNAMALGQLSDDYNPLDLTLSTVHTMKGLEKDIVFLIGMCEGVFPDYRATSEESLDEERNSAFVAITRSRRWLYITYPRYREMRWGDVKAQKASRFIEFK